MLRKLWSIALGLVVSVGLGHALELWGLMHFANYGTTGCKSCNPFSTPPVPFTLSRPYTIWIYDTTNGQMVPEIAIRYGSHDGYWSYSVNPAYLHPGHVYEIWESKASNSAGGCAVVKCVYYLTLNPGGGRQDVKMHARPGEEPWGGGNVGPDYHSNPCNPEEVKLAWVGGALRVRAEKPTELNLKLYDVSGNLLLVKTVSVKAGESSVELPVKGLNVLVVEGENFTKTLKVVK